PRVVDAADTEALDALRASGAVFREHDELRDQLHELLAGREPGRRWTDADLDAAVTQHLAGRDPGEYGVRVHYPWSGPLAHLLPRDELRRVRAGRNRYKITPAEQARLAGARIGVLGLSVGNAAALTLALEGVGTRFRLADLDRLSLSNLNRLRGGVHELGVE